MLCLVIFIAHLFNNSLNKHLLNSLLYMGVTPDAWAVGNQHVLLQLSVPLPRFPHFR